MTKQYLLLILLLLTTCVFVLGQTEQQRIKTKAYAVLLELQNEEEDMVFFTEKREIIKKPKTFDVVKLGRKSHAIPNYYDSYIVLYKKSLYCVDSCYVIDNSILYVANAVIEDNYQRELQRQRDSIILQRQKDSIIHRQKDSIQKLNSIIDLENKIKDIESVMDGRRSYIEKGKYDDIKRFEVGAIINIDSLSRVLQVYTDSVIISKYAPDNEHYRSLSPKLQKFVKTIHVTLHKLDSPNSAGGCDFNFYYWNLSKKTIKYLHWEGYVYNAVGDRVECDIDRTSFVRGKDTGPYEPFSSDCGGTWGTIIYNYSAKSVLITRINITYMDGTSYSIPLSYADWGDLNAYIYTIKTTKGFRGDLIAFDRLKESLTDLYNSKLSEVKKRKERAIPIVNALKNLNVENDSVLRDNAIDLEFCKKELVRLKEEFKEIFQISEERNVGNIFGDN